MEKQYYKKVLISSGEVPEEDEEYITDEGYLFFSINKR